MLHTAPNGAEVYKSMLSYRHFAPTGAVIMKTKILLLILLSAPWPIRAQEPKPSPNPPQASGGGAAPTESTFRLIRSVSGTKLVQDSARYGVEDPRTVFYVPADKEVIVYFTWEGPPGQHRFEGLWKNPSGRVTMTSEFDYKSVQRRFGGYFRMMPGDTPVTGVWNVFTMGPEPRGFATRNLSHRCSA